MADALDARHRRALVSSPTAAGTRPSWRQTWPLHGPQALALLAVYAGLVGLFSVIGWLLTAPRDAWVERRDRMVADWWVRRRTPSWDPWSTVGSWLAETLTKIVLTALVAAVALWVWRRWLEPLMLVLSLVVEASVFITVTTIVRRDRPAVPQMEHSPVGSSFPSGHVAAAVVYGAFAVVVAWHARRRIWVVVGALVVAVVALIVACARMYRGMHFLSDTLAGALLGLLSLMAVRAILVRTPEARAALESDRQPEEVS